MNKADLASRLRTIFQSELEQQVRVMNADLLALERKPDDPERLKSLFRVAHSLKGAADATGMSLIADVCHKLETMLSDARDGSRPLQPQQFAILFRAVDAMEEAGVVLSADGDLSASSLAALDVDLERLMKAAAPGSPAFVGGLSESTSWKPAAAPASPVHESGLPTSDDPAERRNVGSFLRLEPKKLDSMQAAVEQLSMTVGDVLDRLSKSSRLGDSPGAAAEARALATALSELQENVRIVRMRPFGEACEALARVVRDLAANSEKEVSLEMIGEGVEADRGVIDGLREALLQLVRNAVDHGIETAEERDAAGKAAQATVRIAAALRGDRMTVTVADDGRGLDIEALRRRLVELGRPAPADDRAVALALFDGGVSTRLEATPVSGRGVGLNLVSDAVKRLHGTIDVDWIPGGGTTFTLETPLTLASVRALIVGVGQQRFAIPTASVSRVRFVKAEDVRLAEGTTLLVSSNNGGGRPIPIVSLARVLGPPLTEKAMTQRAPAIVIESPSGSLATIVDEILSEQQITIRPIDGRGADVTRYMGAAVLPGGHVALALDIPALITAGSVAAGAGTPFRQTESSAEARHRVLVVDDSITTRALEQSVLEAGGYDTLTAVDGAAAWQILNEELVDLVVADVEMPRMDGFALCEAIRGSSRLNKLPVVLVTALEKPEHRARGLEAGADAYIAKSSFDQKTLLATVERLLG